MVALGVDIGDAPFLSRLDGAACYVASIVLYATFDLFYLLVMAPAEPLFYFGVIEDAIFLVGVTLYALGVCLALGCSVYAVALALTTLTKSLPELTEAFLLFFSLLSGRILVCLGWLSLLRLAIEKCRREERFAIDFGSFTWLSSFTKIESSCLALL